MPQTLGSQIRAARLSRGLTRLQVARAVGTTIPTVCRWETGVHEPSWPLRAALGAFLDLPGLTEPVALLEPVP